MRGSYRANIWDWDNEPDFEEPPFPTRPPEPVIDAIEEVLLVQETVRLYREELQKEFDLAEPH